jgi:hypothetical protein
MVVYLSQGCCNRGIINVKNQNADLCAMLTPSELKRMVINQPRVETTPGLELANAFGVEIKTNPLHPRGLPLAP